jgi:dipeptidase
MCDTFVYIPSQKDRSVIFGKNSDREPGEAQQIVRFPANKRASNKVRTTFIEVEHPSETYEVILSKPFQMWGVEMGCNEHGVAIGNEAVFTKIPFDKKNNGLTGMDMIRLSLEISRTAEEALRNIIFYLEKYGQDACGGYTDKSFFYHNSFIIADNKEGYVLETACRHWVYEKVNRYRAISNGLTIEDKFDGISEHAEEYARKRSWIKKDEAFNFKKAYSSWLMPKLAACSSRRSQSESFGKKDIFSVRDAIAILRSHAQESFDPTKSKTDSICMHASGLFTPHQTVGSMVAELRKHDPPTVWLTGSAAPCLSIFKPFYFGDDLLNEDNLIPPSASSDHSYWWQWEQLHQSILGNYSEKIKIIQDERDSAEELWIQKDKKLIQEKRDMEEARELSHSAMRQSVVLRDEWMKKAGTINDKTNFVYNLFRHKQKRKANIE